MVKGSVQEKNGYLHTVITYQDKDGKRRQKWQATGLAVKGNRRKAEMLLWERITAVELGLERHKEENEKPDLPFSEFLSVRLAVVKSTILITTYGGYPYYVEKRINPFSVFIK